MKEDRNTILIVEDQKINRTILRYMIQNAYDVLEAENGAEAWSILEEKNEEIIAILLDIVMPVMDGFKTSVVEAANRTNRASVDSEVCVPSLASRRSSVCFGTR